MLLNSISTIFYLYIDLSIAFQHCEHLSTVTPLNALPEYEIQQMRFPFNKPSTVLP